jgi:hypothetical protein
MISSAAGKALTKPVVARKSVAIENFMVIFRRGYYMEAGKGLSWC